MTIFMQRVIWPITWWRNTWLSPCTHHTACLTKMEIACEFIVHQSVCYRADSVNPCSKRTSCSAHWDLRESPGRVRIFFLYSGAVFTDSDGGVPIICQFWWPDEGEKRRHVEVVWAREFQNFNSDFRPPGGEVSGTDIFGSCDARIFSWQSFNYMAATAACPLSSEYDILPDVVTLVYENPCARPNVALSLKQVATRRRVKRTGGLAMCVKNLIFLSQRVVERLVEWIELQKMIGVEKIFFYVLYLHPQAMETLRVGIRDNQHSSLATSDLSCSPWTDIRARRICWDAYVVGARCKLQSASVGCVCPLQEHRSQQEAGESVPVGLLLQVGERFCNHDGTGCQTLN